MKTLSYLKGRRSEGKKQIPRTCFLPSKIHGRGTLALTTILACICILLVVSLMGCQTERTATVFGFSREVSDSTTDPEQFNRELEDSLRRNELKRLEEVRTAPGSRK